MALVPASFLVTQVQALSTLREDQTTTHVAFEEALQALREVNAFLREQIASLKTEIETLKGRIALLETTHNAEKAAWEEEKASLQDRNRVAEACIADLTARQAADTKRFTLLHEALSTIEGISCRRSTLAGARYLAFLRAWNNASAIEKFLKREL